AHHDLSMLPIWRATAPQPLDQFEDARYVAGASTVLLSTLVGATYLTTTVAERLRRNERDLWLAKERLEGVLRGLGEGVAYFDAGSHLVLANPSFERLIPATGAKRRLAEIAPDGVRAPLQAALAKLEAGSP